MNDDLLVSYLLNEADAATSRMVEEWIIEQPANQRYFEQFRLIWQASHEIAIPTSVNEEQAWQRFRVRTMAANPPAGKVRTIGGLSKRWMMAASVIISIGLVAASYFILNNSPVTVATAEVPKKETLPDGSVVSLNKYSEIRYHPKFKGSVRRLHLKGEAFFNVKPDKTKPFEVDANDVKVTVVGTSFNIRTNDSITEIIVETGIVKVEKQNQTILLHPNEKLLIRAKGQPPQIEKSNDILHQYYRTHEFVCDNTPLWKLVEILNEAYGANIVIANNQLKSLPLTTTFYNESLENILSVISETFNISVERQANNIILK